MPLRLRTTTIRRNNKTYRYHQLARAVRRNGKPTHEIVAHLGRLDDKEAAAMREALRELAASGEQGSKPTVEQVLCRLEDVVAHKALRYLDVRVVHRAWQAWGLQAFFERHLPRGEQDVAPADIVQVLVSNRCLAPCSKLRVTEWMPRTALAELLGVRPEQINNTRIHRVLERLEGIEDALSDFLVEHPQRGGLDSVIYLDFTDTWFVGRGGDLAAPRMCKDKSYQPHRIQIALAVDRRGLPLRWEVIAGNAAENKELPKWIAALARFPRLRDLPLVFDRGLSTNDNLIRLLDAQRRFVTCAPQPTVSDWTNDIDFDAIAKTPATERPPAECLQKAGLVADPGNDDVFYLDQGVRLPHTTKTPLPPMRVVLLFKPSQYAFDTYRIAQDRSKLHQAISRINEDLATAVRNREEGKTLSRVMRELRLRQQEYDYAPRLEPVEIKHGRKTIRSFRVHLDKQDYATRARDYNAGWRVLLASPQDDRPATELIRQYDQKQAVENAFKLIKSFTQLKPVRHQQTPKIKAHVTICVLAMMLDRWLELQLREAGVSDAIDRVYEALDSCRLHVLTTRGGKRPRYQLIATELDKHQRELLAALGMRDLASQDAVSELSRCRY